MNNDNKNIQYKILKSEACGHTIEYKMVKKEHELEKARVDEGMSPREKMKAREARSTKEREPKELNPEQYQTAKKIARTKAVTETGEKERKQTLKDALHTHKQNIPKSPSKEDLEYPMAASEKECECEDKAEKCECEDKEMKKRKKFYIQKIQELRKAGYPLRHNLSEEDQKQIDEMSRNRAIKNLENRFNEEKPSKLDNMTFSAGNDKKPVSARKMVDRMSSLPENMRAGQQNLVYPNPTGSGPGTYVAPSAVADEFNRKYKSGSKSNLGEYVMRDAPQGTERSTQGILNNMTGFLPKQTAPANTAPANAAPANAAPQRMQFGKDSGVSFKDAFAQARKAGNQEFDWFNPKTGKMQPYHTHTKEEFQQGKTLAAGRNPEGFQSQAIGADNKYFKGWQAGQKTPAATTPAVAPKNEMAPLEQKQKQFS